MFHQTNNIKYDGKKNSIDIYLDPKFLNILRDLPLSKLKICKKNEEFTDIRINNNIQSILNVNLENQCKLIEKPINIQINSFNQTVKIFE